ncbi:MAG: DUF1127 domain-containing protein [Janthinobacterium lividum]
MTARTATAAPSLPLAAPLAAAISHGAAFLRARRQRRALAAELSDLSEHQLADIGLTRAPEPATPFGLPTALYR